MRFPWAAEPIEEDDLVIDIRDRIAPYMKDVDDEPTSENPASFMHAHPLRTKPLQAKR
jgi:hypothetical protein